jgi:hypothetical protein
MPPPEPVEDRFVDGRLRSTRDRDATHEHRVTIGLKDPEVGVDRVVVKAGVSRHGIPHGKVGPLEILRLQNLAGVERLQRLVDDRRRGCGWRRRLTLCV